MKTTRTPDNVTVRLTEERWSHIRSRHPEMETQEQRILETVANPDMIQAGDFGATIALRHYAQTPLTSKHLVVAYRVLSEQDGFIVTAYFATKPAAGRIILWKR